MPPRPNDERRVGRRIGSSSLALETTHAAALVVKEKFGDEQPVKNVAVAEVDRECEVAIDE